MAPLLVFTCSRFSSFSAADCNEAVSFTFSFFSNHVSCLDGIRVKAYFIPPVETCCREINKSTGFPVFIELDEPFDRSLILDRALAEVHEIDGFLIEQNLMLVLAMLMQGSNQHLLCCYL